MYVTYATGQEDCVGSWLQIAVGNKKQSRIFYDDFLQLTESAEEFRESDGIPVSLEKGENCLRFMNHRRQENTLNSYAKLLEGLNLVNPGHDVILSICEWGKTQPQNWGYKVGDSWRILNDITFCVGADGDPGTGSWSDDYTASVTSQYNKAVIMDEYAGLDKGWNDPDMLMVGMNGLTDVMCKTHFSMWCMMNAPLMLGMDLRRVKKGDGIWKIISNKELIALNQDSLGIQAKRVFCSLNPENPDTSYIVDNNRVDILAKPLADGSLALSFINLSGERKGEYRVNAMDLIRKIGDKMINQDTFAQAEEYRVLDLWSEQVTVNATGSFGVDELTPYDSVTIRVTPVVR